MFTIVTEEIRESALPFNTVNTTFPAVEKVTPEFAMMFPTIMPPPAPLIVAESLWQYSHHVLAGLTTHKGPILTVANWSGQWPGLVGLLNLNGSLTKAGVKFSAVLKDASEDTFTVTVTKQVKPEGAKRKITVEEDAVYSYNEVKYTKYLIRFK